MPLLAKGLLRIYVPFVTSTVTSTAACLRALGCTTVTCLPICL